MSLTPVSNSPARLAFLAIILLATKTPMAAEATPHILFDTDMASDCDDAAALGLLHVLADRGECEILATLVSSKHPFSAPAVSAINAFYGRGNLPIGVPKGPGVDIHSKYARAVAEAFGGAIKSDADAPDAVEVMRRVLESQPDSSVTLVTVGYLTNVAGLLDSAARDGSLSGMDLARRKVSRWICMGGNFIGSPARDRFDAKGKLDNVNFTRDAKSTLRAIDRWPGPIVFVGREVASVPSGVAIGAGFTALPEHHPVRAAYAHYFGGVPKNRHVADPATVLYAVRGLRDYWDIEPRGDIDLQPDMQFRWRYDRPPYYPRAYLLKKRDAAGVPNDRHIERTLEELIVSPPQAAPR